MYRIIGADGREYGPISADQLRQWIAEGRANAQTKVLLEGTAEWKALGELPEFAAAIPSNPPPTASLQAPISARASNKIVAGVCGILIGGLGIHKFILGYTRAGIIQIVITVVTCGIGHILGLIEGIIYLTRSDEEFVRIYVDGRKEWF